LWQWTPGLRLNGGEIQVLADNNAALASADFSLASTQWMAIMPDGSLVAPGTTGTLKWDWVSSKITLTDTITTQADASRQTNYELLAKAAAITTVPQILNELGIHPAETGYQNDNIWMNNSGERMPRRGGNWNNGASAGVFALNLNNVRSIVNSNVGFRPALLLNRGNAAVRYCKLTGLLSAQGGLKEIVPPATRKLSRKKE
jgi:hypothetical protein